MRCGYACGSSDHLVSRRGFLGSLAGAGAIGGFGIFSQQAVAEELARQNKQVLLVFLAGGVSQLESWDPKPGTDTGGPFRPISTKVPGTQICELLPYTAQQMHRLSLVRSINTKENDHGKGAYFMQTGRRQTPASDFPHLGSLSAMLLGSDQNPLPGYIHITPKGTGVDRRDAAFLGPKYAAVKLDGGQAPANSERPKAISSEEDVRRNLLRRQFNDHFAYRRRTAETEAYSASYEQALQLMERRDVFDLGKACPKEIDRYGTHDFGRHCLLARRLLENDVTFVKVTHTNYDTHNENFNFHIEQLGEFDRPFATLVNDLAERDRLKNTLIVVMSEFGRTPKINSKFGRDHWGTAWSVALGGAGIQPEAVIGKTNQNGTKVTDREVDAGHLFHTYLRAVGIVSDEPHEIGGRAVQIADPEATPIKELLA